METWLCESIMNAGLQLAGFQLFEVDFDTSFQQQQNVGNMFGYNVLGVSTLCHSSCNVGIIILLG